MKQEKIDRQVILMVQPSLYDQFKDKCKTNYQTVSEVLRKLMLEYVRRDDEAR